MFWSTLALRQIKVIMTHRHRAKYNAVNNLMSSVLPTFYRPTMSSKRDCLGHSLTVLHPEYQFQNLVTGQAWIPICTSSNSIASAGDSYTKATNYVPFLMNKLLAERQNMSMHVCKLYLTIKTSIRFGPCSCHSKSWQYSLNPISATALGIVL